MPPPIAHHGIDASTVEPPRLRDGNSGARNGDLREIVGAAATAMLRRLDAIQHAADGAAAYCAQQVDVMTESDLYGPPSASHKGRSARPPVLAGGGGGGGASYSLSGPATSALEAVTSKLGGVRNTTEAALQDVATLLQELMECFPLARDDAAMRDLPNNPYEASAADWLRCVSGLKQRLAECRDDIRDRDATIVDLEARHERRERSFKYVKEQLQHEIAQLRSERGAAADPHGAFATLDLFLVLGDSGTDKQLFEKIQELVSLLANHENRSAVAEASLMRATTRIQNLDKQRLAAESRTKHLAERMTNETTKLKIAVLHAERNNTALTQEVTAFSKQVDQARAIATSERSKAQAAEAERDAIELQLIKLKQGQHAEKEHLYVTIASLATKIHAEEKKMYKRWTVDPKREFVDKAGLIASSGKAPHTDRETLELLLAVANPPDDPRLVATAAAQRKRIDDLLKDVEIWRDVAAEVARQRDAAEARASELAEDSKRMQQFMHEKGVPIPQLNQMRQRTIAVQPDAAGEAALRTMVRTMRTESDIAIRRMRGGIDRHRATVLKLKDVAPVTQQNGSLDECFHIAADSFGGDEDEGEGDDMRSREELSGLGQGITYVEDAASQMRDVALCLAEEVRRLREQASTNNVGMFEERDRWLEAWQTLLRALPVPVAAKLRLQGLSSLTSKTVADHFDKAVADAQEALRLQAEKQRTSILEECRAEAEAELSLRESLLADREASIQQQADDRVAKITAECRALEAQLAKAEAAQMAKSVSSSTAKTPKSTGATGKPPAGVGSKKSPTAAGPSKRPVVAPAKHPVDTTDASVQWDEAACPVKPPPKSWDAESQTAPNARFDHPDTFFFPAGTQTERYADNQRFASTDTGGLRAASTNDCHAQAQTETYECGTQAGDFEPEQPQQPAVPSRGSLLPEHEADIEAALAEVRLFATELGEIHHHRRSTGGSQRTAHREVAGESMVALALAGRQLACNVCGTSARIDGWRAAQHASHAIQTDLVLNDCEVAPSRTLQAQQSHSAQTEASYIEGAGWSETSGALFARPRRSSATSTPRNGGGLDSAGKSRRPPSGKSAAPLPPMTTALQPLVNAFAQTVGAIADEDELEEFRRRVQELQYMAERAQQRADKAEDAARKTKQPAAAATRSSAPEGLAIPPRQPRRQVSHKEQMLARSMSPPHPMFHHSLARERVAATAAAVDHLNAGRAGSPRDLPDVGSSHQRRRVLPGAAGVAQTPPPRLPSVQGAQQDVLLPRIRELARARSRQQPRR